jgi:hypothetical protein
VVTRPHRALVVAGTAVFAGVGALTVAIAASSRDIGYVAIPLAGPFLGGAALAMAPCSWFCGVQSAAAAALFVAGLAEVAGAAMLVVGLGTKQQVLRANIALPVIPVPFVMRNGSGLALAGTF